MLTTHYMEEAERLCDRVAVVDQGRVIALGPPSELIAAFRERGLDDALDGACSGLALPPRERGTVVGDARPQPSFRQSTNSRYTIGAASPLRGPRLTTRV